VRNAAGTLEAWSVEATGERLRKQSRALAARSTITIPAVGTLPSFDVQLREPSDAAPDEIKTRTRPPLFVVADTHGEFEILAQMLLKHRIVDAKLRWNFGSGHLVILGDVFDRGAHQTEILWLIYALEAQARKAGGGVHLLLGNHEVMVLSGDQRYLNAKYRLTAQALDVSYPDLFSATSVLGQWLRTKPTILKINRLLCLHGGVSPEVVARRLTVPQINSILRTFLNGQPFPSHAEEERAQFLTGRTGPLWYRGYFATDERDADTAIENIERSLEHFDVTTILVGHTRVPTITALHESKVIAVQVYPQRDERGSTMFEALLIRNGKFYRALPDGNLQTLTLPATSEPQP
jgi:hypothetical protein